MLITMLISLYTARVFLNTLGASDYGLYTLISGVIFMFGFLQDTLTRATLRYLCVYKVEGDLVKQRKVFSISMLLHFAISLFIMTNLLIINNFLFSGFLNIPPDRLLTARYVYYFMIASFAFTVMSIPYDSVLNANENMFFYSFVGIAESLLKLFLAIVLPFVDSDKLIFYSLFLSLITIVSLIVKRVYCHWKYEECRFRIAYYDKYMAQNMISYAGWNFLTSISSLISFNAMPILLNKFYGTVLNAAQGIATQVNGVLTQFSSNMLKALNPTITKNGAGENVENMMKFGLTGSKLSFVILCFFAVPIIVECPYVLQLWLVNVPDWASVFCVMLLIRSLANQLTIVFSDCIYASQDIKYYCIFKSILNIMPIVFVYIVFKMGGAPYLLYVILFGCWEVLGGIVILYFNRKKYQLKIWLYLKTLLFPCIILLLIEYGCGLLITTLMEVSLFRLIIVIFNSTVLCLSLSWILVFGEIERKLILDILYNSIRKWKQ